MKIIITAFTSAVISAVLTVTLNGYLLSPGAVDNHRASDEQIRQLNEKLERLAQTQAQLGEQLTGARQQWKSTDLQGLSNLAQESVDEHQTSSRPISTPVTEPQSTKQQHLEHFQQLEDQFYNEGYDAQWAGEMQYSFAEVEARLEEFNLADTRIVSQECRSSTCRVEFDHGESVAALIPSLLAAQGTREMVLQKISDQFGERTVAIYRR